MASITGKHRPSKHNTFTAAVHAYTDNKPSADSDTKFDLNKIPAKPLEEHTDIKRDDLSDAIWNQRNLRLKDLYCQ